MKSITKWLTLLASCTVNLLYASEPQQKAKQETSMLHNVAVGSMAGITEVCFLGQPLSYAMNQMVQRKSLASNPLYWYRGCGANAAGMAPITAIQKAGDARLQLWVKNSEEHELSGAQKIATSFVAGAASAVASTPSEAIPVYMQKPENTQMSTLQAISNLKLRSWRGFGPTATRDGLFTVGYNALAPMAQEKACAVMGKSPMAQVAGGIVAGMLTAVATQPLAVVKTEMQANQHYKSALETSRAIYQKEGVGGLFKGLTARGARVMVAIPVLTKAGQVYSDMLTSHNT